MSLGTVGDEGRPDDSIGLTILELTSKFGVHPRLRRGQTAKRREGLECLGRRIEGGGKISLESRTNTDSVSSILPSYESPLLLPFFASSGLILLRFHSSPFGQPTCQSLPFCSLEALPRAFWPLSLPHSLSVPDDLQPSQGTVFFSDWQSPLPLQLSFSIFPVWPVLELCLSCL